MSKVHLVIPDQHAHPEHHNDRADWLGKLIKDLKPDVVVNLGDAADMPSLSAYEKGTKAFVGRAYEKDITSHLDFQERMWEPTRKSKRKRPTAVVLEGNHEHRIKKAINIQPELEGDRYGVSFKDLDFNRYYHEVIEYEGSTPGITTIDGVSYAHYFISGVMGRPIGGEHHAYSLLAKHYSSCTCGHSHLADFSVRTNVHGKKIMGTVAGVFQDYTSGWAGASNSLWWRGLVIKRNVEDGVYDSEFVSIDRLRKEYG